MYKMSGLVVILGLLTTTRPAPINGTDEIDCLQKGAESRTSPNVSNCTKYYQCENGTKTEKVCPFGQHFNTRLRVCDDPKYAKCKVNETTLSTLNTTSETPSTLNNISETDLSHIREKEPHVLKPKVPQNTTTASNVTATNTTTNQNDTSSGFTNATTTSFTKVIEVTTESEVSGKARSISTTGTSTTKGSIDLSQVVIGSNVTVKNDSTQESTPTTKAATDVDVTTLVEKGEENNEESEEGNGDNEGNEDNHKENEKQTNPKKVTQ